MTAAPHYIVLGNEKGGSGKSTTAMHVAIGLLRLGYRVGSIDLDARQGTLTRYMANRFEYIARHKLSLPSPVHFPIEKSKAATVEEQERQDYDFFMMARDEMTGLVDFVVVDTPGSDTYLGQVSHSYADTIITPMNDSFIDLDVLARIDTATLDIKGASVYTKMVMEQRDKKKRGTALIWTGLSCATVCRLWMPKTNAKWVICLILYQRRSASDWRPVSANG